MELNEKLKQLRKSRGITQQELADAIYVSRSAVAKWENGLGLPSPESMEALEKYFGIRQTEIATAQPEQVIVKKNQKLRWLCSALGILALLLLFIISLALPCLLYSGNYGFTPEMLADHYPDGAYIDTGDYRIYYSSFEGDWADGRHWTSLSHFTPVQLHFWGCTVSEKDYACNVILHNLTKVGQLYSIRGKGGYYHIIRNSSGNSIDANLITAQSVRANGVTCPLQAGFFFVTQEPVECFWIGTEFYTVE